MRYRALTSRSPWWWIVVVVAQATTKVAGHGDSTRVRTAVGAAFGPRPDPAARRALMLATSGLLVLAAIGLSVLALLVLALAAPSVSLYSAVLAPAYLVGAIAVAWSIRAGLNEVDDRRKRQFADVGSALPSWWTQPATLDLAIALAVASALVLVP
ncbi:hypothetical protein CSO01_23290 [Cellulomonas soli]|uniref:Uncharacterized protein n=2 Tax=Cellulomonas soli TaxID=931535 RepID=A0A512PEH8_9CELL|nr:hypothetical protein CSO01_23290 [Cellulomonas soli]